MINCKTKGAALMLKHGILGLLNYHPMTGYEIMLVFRDSLLFFLECTDKPDLSGTTNVGSERLGGKNISVPAE